MKENAKVIRIGVLTFVRSYNFGTLMQAYATIKILQEAFGDTCKVELVNIKFWKSPNQQAGVLIKLNGKRFRDYIFFLRNKIEHSRMKLFYRRQFNSSPEFTCSDFESSLAYLEKQNYDIIISGSDEIWANKNNIPIPNIFFIPPKIKSVKMSIATSSNRGDLDLLSIEQRNYIMDSIKEYKYLSVRDKNTQVFVQSLTGKNSHLMFDPTLAYDFPVIKYNSILLPLLNIRKKKSIALMLSNRAIAEDIIDNFSNEFFIVSLVNNHRKTYNIKLHNPMQFAQIFSKFSLVITDYFHGTVFSIKTDTPFISIDSEPIYMKYESKIHDMLLRLGLEKHYFPIWCLDSDISISLHNKINDLIKNGNKMDFSAAREYVRQDYFSALNNIKKIIQEMSDEVC